MDPVQSWLDAKEVRRMAESLMAPAPEVDKSAVDAGYGEAFEGFAEGVDNDTVEPDEVASEVASEVESNGAPHDQSQLGSDSSTPLEDEVLPVGPHGVELEPTQSDDEQPDDEQSDDEAPVESKRVVEDNAGADASSVAKGSGMLTSDKPADLETPADQETPGEDEPDSPLPRTIVNIKSVYDSPFKIAPDQAQGRDDLMAYRGSATVGDANPFSSRTELTGSEMNIAETSVPPEVESPVAEQPVAEQPVAEQPVAEPPVAESPVAEPPAAEPPAAEPPVAEPPVVDSPFDGQPSTDDLGSSPFRPVFDEEATAEPSDPQDELGAAEKPGLAQEEEAAEPAVSPQEPDVFPRDPAVAPEVRTEGAADHVPVGVRGPFLTRLQQFSEIIRRDLGAQAMFLIDNEGQVLLDEVENAKLIQVARTLANASYRASRQTAGAAAVGNLHVKIGASVTLEVIPVETRYGLLILGVIFPAPIGAARVIQVADELFRTVEPHY